MNNDLEDSCFEIEHEGQTAVVTYHNEDGKEYYKLEWPDYSLDFLYYDREFVTPVWRSHSLRDDKVINELVRLIDEKLN